MKRLQEVEVIMVMTAMAKSNFFMMSRVDLFYNKVYESNKSRCSCEKLGCVQLAQTTTAFSFTVSSLEGRDETAARGRSDQGDYGNGEE